MDVLGLAMTMSTPLEIPVVATLRHTQGRDVSTAERLETERGIISNGVNLEEPPVGPRDDDVTFFHPPINHFHKGKKFTLLPEYFSSAS